MSQTNSIASDQKWCTTCKWVGTNAAQNADTYRCFAPQNFARINLVNGSKIYRMEFCKDQRESTSSTDYYYCAAIGNWWEAAPPRAESQPYQAVPTPPKSPLKIKVGTNFIDELGM